MHFSEKGLQWGSENLMSFIYLLSNPERVTLCALLCTSVFTLFFCWCKTVWLIHLFLLSAIQNAGVYYHKLLWAIKTPGIELKLSEIICEQFPVSHSQLPRGKNQTKNITKIASQESLISQKVVQGVWPPLHPKKLQFNEEVKK